MTMTETQVHPAAREDAWNEIAKRVRGLRLELEDAIGDAEKNRIPTEHLEAADNGLAAFLKQHAE